MCTTFGHQLIEGRGRTLPCQHQNPNLFVDSGHATPLTLKRTNGFVISSSLLHTGSACRRANSAQDSLPRHSKKRSVTWPKIPDFLLPQCFNLPGTFIHLQFQLMGLSQNSSAEPKSFTPDLFTDPFRKMLLWNNFETFDPLFHNLRKSHIHTLLRESLLRAFLWDQSSPPRLSLPAPQALAPARQSVVTLVPSWPIPPRRSLPESEALAHARRSAVALVPLEPTSPPVLHDGRHRGYPPSDERLGL